MEVQTDLEVSFPDKLSFLFEPHRYKVPYGGRGSAKSWSIARALLLIGKQPSLLWPGWDDSNGIRILCYRETMRSIEESVHQLLEDQIRLLKLGDFYTVQLKNIVGANGTEFFFAGVRQSVDNLKSYEGVDIAWGSQAEAMSKRSLNVVIPTLRKDIIVGDKQYGSELWFDFNPQFETDEIYKMFVVGQQPHDSIVRKVNWNDNPWFPAVLQREREDLIRRDPDEAAHVYDGLLRTTVEGAIYKKEIQAAEREQRIRRVPWESSHPVNTYWDLGFGDTNSIWFAQSIGFEFRVIDYYAGELQGLAHYIKVLKEKPYAYGQHWLPWDGAARELGTGRSIQEQLAEHFGKASVKCTKKLTVEDGIAAVRAIFPKCWFDAEKCESEVSPTIRSGLRGLRCYEFEYDKDLRTFGQHPLHNWASHPADAFRTMAVSIREEQKPKETKENPPPKVGVWS